MFLPTDTAFKMVKIILVTPKCKNILVLLKFHFLFCYINIGIFFIAPYKVIALCKVIALGKVMAQL